MRPNGAHPAMAESSLPTPPAPVTQTPDTPDAPTGRSTRRRVARIVLALLAIALIILVVLAARVAVPAWRGYQAANDLLVQVQGGIDTLDPVAVEKSLREADAALDGVAESMAPFNPIVRRLGFVPTWGSTLAATPALLAVAQPLSNLALEVAPLTGAALEGEDTIARAAGLATALAAEPDRIERMAAHARAASHALAQVPVETLHPALAGRLAIAAPLLDRLPDLLPALPGLPTLLGMNEPHTLLMLVQNNHELRPTGGFITAVGRVTLDKGQITELRFNDSFQVFVPETDYPPPPPAMQRHMGIPYLTFRDANWSPDLPTTVQIAGTLYTQDTGQSFDDVITLDLNAVQLIIAALSPLKLEGIDEPVTGANIIGIMKQLWARPADVDVAIDADLGEWWRQRKTFIPLLAQAALQKILAGSEPLLLADAVVQALDERGVQAVIDEPALAAVFAAQHWDGSLQPGPAGSDFLALVDTNMGFNKVDAAVSRSLAYTVTPAADGESPALAEVSVTYTHPISASDPGCDQTPRYGNSYDDMIARCAFIYPRLYVPGGSSLIETTGVPTDTVTSQRGEQGTTVFSGYLVIEPNSSATVTWRYALPDEVAMSPDGYRLVVQRQAGSGPLALSLNTPAGATALTLEKGRLEVGAPPAAGEEPAP
jgi:hypothetical protein